MNFGHSAERDFDTFAYPYPGKSAIRKIFLLRLAGSWVTSKKLIVRVRPGVELTCAIFAPTSALIRDDLPTFDRPAKAISGKSGAGNRRGSAALRTNSA